MKSCLNCGEKITGQYCSHCGQKAKIERITLSYFYNELLHFFTHLDHGFLYTSFQLIVSPGRTTLNYIDGKRKKYQSPVSFFLIWITIYLLILYWVEHYFGENSVINYQNYFGSYTTTKVAIAHLAWVLVAVIPFQAFYLYVLITHKKYYYFETMVANFYSMGTIILFQVLFAILSLIFHVLTGISTDLATSDIFKVLYLIWFTLSLVRLFDVQGKFIKGILFMILSFGTFTFWRMYGLNYIINWIH